MTGLNTKGLKILGFLAFLFILCSCSIFDDRYFIFDKTRFDTEKKAWESQNIEGYTFVQKFDSDASPGERVKITVLPGKDPVIENLETSQMYPAYYLSDTLSGIYTSIESSAEDARKYYNAGKCHAVDFIITYNRQYHYPESVSYRVWYTKKNLVDGGPGYTLQITEFTLSSGP